MQRAHANIEIHTFAIFRSLANSQLLLCTTTSATSETAQRARITKWRLDNATLLRVLRDAGGKTEPRDQACYYANKAIYISMRLSMCSTFERNCRGRRHRNLRLLVHYATNNAQHAHQYDQAGDSDCLLPVTASRNRLTLLKAPQRTLERCVQA